MKTNKHDRICPVERAGMLDSPLRRFMLNPEKIIKPYIQEGMTVLDVGCGPGVCTVEIAKMLNASGKVIAADVQEGMLEIVKEKIKGTALEQIVEIHKSDFERIGIDEKVDFVLAFYMIHEVRNRQKFLEEINSILKPNSLFLIIEPKFEVSKINFLTMVDEIKQLGFTVVESPKVFFSRAVVFRK